MRPGHAALSRRTLRWAAEPGHPRSGDPRAVRQACPLSLAQDFAVSAGFLPGLRQSISTPAAGQGLLWPATEAVVREKKVCQVFYRCTMITRWRGWICRHCCSRSSRRYLRTWIVTRVCGSGCVVRIPDGERCRADGGRSAPGDIA